MGRMHNPGKGMSKSALPYRRSVPSWQKLTGEDVQDHIVKLAKKGLRPSQIGVILRDTHGIGQVRRLAGNKIFRILKAKGMAPELPEDLYHLIKKAVAIRKHLERSRKDIDSKYRLILVESRIHRLARYYKTKRQLPPTWKFEKFSFSYRHPRISVGRLSAGPARSVVVSTDRGARRERQMSASLETEFERTRYRVGSLGRLRELPLRDKFNPFFSPNNAVILYDKKGEVIDALDMTGSVVDIAWDREGDSLAVAGTSSSLITVWEINSRSTEQIESGVASTKEIPTCLAWSPVSLTLACGNNAGNLFIYNHRTARKISLMGKHQRSITQIKFTNDDLIVTCSDDNTIVVSNVDGDTVSTTSVTGEPGNLDIGVVLRGGVPHTMLSCTLGRKILMLASLNALESPSNLQFQERYGNIVDYTWFNDGFLAIGFDKGSIVTISAQQSELGSEMSSINEYKTYLGAVVASPSFGKILSVGDHQLKVREMGQMSDLYLMLDVDADRDLCSLACSDDGQLVAVGSQAGQISVYLTRMPSLGASYQDIIVTLSSLTQVTVQSEGDKTRSATVEIFVEPSIIAVGPCHVAAATNNIVSFFEYSFSLSSHFPSAVDKVPEPVSKVEYLSTVLGIQLNYEYAAVTMAGKVRLHKIVESDESRSATFPEPSRNARLLTAALSENFLIFTTDNHYIVYFSLEEWAVVSEYRHSSPIRSVFPHPQSVSCCCFDDRLETIVYSAIDDVVLKVEPVGSTVHYKGVLWETFTIDKGTFVIFDNQNLYVFLLTKGRIDGNAVLYIGSTKLPFGHTPLALSKGIVHCLTTVKSSSVLLESHKTDTQLEGKSQQQSSFNKHYYFKDGRMLGGSAISPANSHIGTYLRMRPLRIFRNIGDVAMVAALEQVKFIEEKNLLAAQVAVILGKYDEAEEIFLRSSKPREALNMRRDLLEWPKALLLAEKLASDEIPFISKEYAQELELMGDDANALMNYEKGVVDSEQHTYDRSPAEISEHNEICTSGIARMSIKTGDLRRGIQLAKSLPGRVVKRDCAIILEQIKQYTEAAQLYEIGLFFDRAAAVCLKANAWGKVGELLDKVKSPKVHVQYAKIMENERKYKQAAISYERGRDYDNLVRVLLDHLNMPEEAVRVVRESRSIEGAKLVAKFFSRLGDHSSAIQFLVMSQCVQEAFQVAEAYDCMNEYASAIEDIGTPEQAIELAQHLGRAGDAFNAAKFHMKGGQFATAMDLLMGLGDRSDAMLLAIECAHKADDRQLTLNLIRFFLGGVDGVPKDSAYLFRLYVQLGQVREAAKTAVIVSGEHQSRGSYRIARDVLYSMFSKLKEKEMKVPQEMEHNLMVVHSYMIVKGLISRRDTVKAARMLLRTCNNISRFPTHVVQILTSTVVVCSQAHFRHSAYKWATVLMKPEHRTKIHEKYKKKIEDIVRKSGKEVLDPEEPRTPCPYCKNLLPETDLTCNNCNNNIPYCVITGRHIVADDFALCGGCQFPGYFSEFKRLASLEEKCPLCDEELRQVIPRDITSFLGEA
ncbi:unnamed protein product [Caenorhabditis auriculariae]|uniref:Small ribosomal subunit protein uS15 n=1 Tax=Caenorhabditis auriculariae TaxID=2777116 RepID=A0A8S1GY86_9PELO|nr:unnamed protein product [Caenorhabditis auriculariae]